MKVFVRADASVNAGSGHVMRCLVLARELKNQGAECVFIVNSEAPGIVSALSEFPFVINPGYGPEPCDIVLVDHYGLDESYEVRWHDQARVVAVIDDLADRRHVCDVLIDQTYGRAMQDYKPRVPKDALLLCGSDYALLRPQFSAQREKSLKRRAHVTQVEHILVTFGSTNPDKITQRVLEGLEQYKERALKIYVVMGAQAEGINDVKEMAKHSKIHEVSVHVNVSDMAQFMARADLAIGAGGTTSWERCCLGLPTLLIEIADNQRVIARNLHDLGAAVFLGRHKSLKALDIASAFEKLHKEAGKLQEMSMKAAKICDGRGSERVAEAIAGRLRDKT